MTDEHYGTYRKSLISWLLVIPLAFLVATSVYYVLMIASRL